MRRRLARVPGPRDAVRFLGHLGRPTRVSALRAVRDGVTVTRELRRRGLRPLLDRPGGSAAGTAARPDPEQARKVAAAVDAGLALLPLAPTCLRRSVTLVRELDRLALPCALHIGVRNRGAAVEAHAWVQVEDVVVNDDPALTGTYAELGAAGDVQRLLPQLR